MEAMAIGLILCLSTVPSILRCTLFESLMSTDRIFSVVSISTLDFLLLSMIISIRFSSALASSIGILSSLFLIAIFSDIFSLSATSSMILSVMSTIFFLYCSMLISIFTSFRERSGQSQTLSHGLLAQERLLILQPEQRVVLQLGHVFQAQPVQLPSA